MATEQKKIIDCYWFLQNQCVKGAECEYRHSEAALNNTTVCKFWVEGRCNNESCTFRHPSGVQTITKDRSQIPCAYYGQGKCTKGDACPFSHGISGSASVVDVEKKKKEEEEELRRLQEERKREEEKLARLKAEGEKLQKEKIKKKASIQKPQITVAQDRRKSAAAAAGAGVGTFVKSFDEIIKEKAKEEQTAKYKAGENRVQQKKSELAAKNKKGETKKAENKKAENKKAENKEDKGKKVAGEKAKSQQTTEPTGPTNFGVKSFNQIMKERQEAPDNESTEDPAKSTPPAKSSTYVEALRKKNQEKFGVSPTTKPLKGETAAKPQAAKVVSIVKDTSPKRKLTDAPKVGQRTEVKKQKVEQSPKINIKKSISTDNMDEFDRELADLGVDVSSTADLSVDVDGDEFDKELNEIEDLMNA